MARAHAILRRLEVGVRRAAESVAGGDYRSAFRGKGMEFDQVVKYEYGDDVRDIDWKVTARLGEPYRKKYIEEREVTLFLVFEDSVSLRFGSGERTKRESLLEVAAMLGLLTSLNRDRLGVVYASPEQCWIAEPARGRRAVMHNCAKLLEQTPSEAWMDPAAGDCVVPWKKVFATAPRHSAIFWMGDFPPRPAPAGWSAMRERYELVGIRADDPWERTFPEVSGLTVFDPVSSRLMVLDAYSTEQRRAHAAWIGDRELAWEALFPAPRERMVMGTEEKTLEALSAFLRRRRGPR